jgi:hypothetical protein
MSFKMYGLDQIAQKLVLTCRMPTGQRPQSVMGQAYKMRTTVAYGLERFWGEHLRLGPDTDEGRYWQDVWRVLVEDILQPSGIQLPNHNVVIVSAPARESEQDKQRREARNTQQITAMAEALWQFAEQNPKQQRIALSVLMQLCDSLVWWTQRYKQD